MSRYGKAFLEDLNRRYPDAAAAVNDFVNRVGPWAWADPDHLSNPVLSRNPYTSRLLERLLKNEDPGPPWPAWKTARAILVHYAKSFAGYTRYALWHLLFRLSAGSRKRVRPPVSSGATIMVDTFVLVEQVLAEGTWRPSYFEGLFSVLDRAGRDYVVLPTVIGWHRWREAPRFFRLLYGSGLPVLCEFELLGPADHLRLVAFILRYPFKVLSLVRRLGGEKIDRLAAEECLRTLEQPVFDSHARYLLGRKIPRPSAGGLQLISWFENQVIDKNLYRGVRAGGGDARIHGCRPFVFSFTQLNFYSIRAEAAAGLLPDVLLSNGPHYLGWAESDLPLEHRRCPSFRYRRLFEPAHPPLSETRPLVILPYFEQETRDIIFLCQASKLSRHPLVMKPHPSHTEQAVRRYTASAPAGWSLRREPLHELFPGTYLVVSSESGACVEAAVLGLSVIVIANQVSFTSNPLPPEGRGLIWELAYDAADLDRAADTLLAARADRAGEIQILARSYRDNFFTEPTEENIRRAFDL